MKIRHRGQYIHLYFIILWAISNDYWERHTKGTDRTEQKRKIQTSVIIEKKT
jgi:1,4-dihydroxy-2-naphthoate octaprenyltransferase